MIAWNMVKTLAWLQRIGVAAGGGGAVAFNTNALNLKEFKLPGNNFEMVCAVGSSAASNRKIAIISIYIPPKQRVETTSKLKDCLSDGINKLKCTYNDPIIIIGGDTNNRSLSNLVIDFPDIQVVDAPPRPPGKVPSLTKVP